jgi:hypothetical protein
MIGIQIGIQDDAALPATRTKFVRAAVLILITAVLAPFYWTSYHTPAVGFHHDDAIYVVTGKALASGEGYRLVHVPDKPEQTKYPVVLPAVLASIWMISPEFPQNLPFLKLVPLIAAIGWLWATYRLLSARKPAAAAPIIFLVAASPVSIFFSTSILAESLLAIFASLSLLWLDRAGDSHTGVRDALVAAVFASLAFNCKTIGVLVVIAGAVTLAWQRRYKALLVFALISVALCLPWVVWQFAHADAATVDSYNSLNNYYKDWSLLGRPWQEQIAVVRRNLLLIALFPIFYFGGSPHVLSVCLAVASTAFLIAGFIGDIRKFRLQPLHIYTALYLLTIVIWPWPPFRFLWSISPFLLYFGYLGLAGAWRQAPVLATIAIVICFGFALPQQRNAVKLASAPTLASGPPQIRWPDFLQAMEQVRSKTSSQDRMLGMLDPTIYLYTGRQAVRGFNADPVKLFYSDDAEHALGDEREFERSISLRRIDWILDMPPGHFAEGPVLSKLIEEYLATRNYAPDDVLTAAPGFRLIKTRPAVLPER